MPREHTVKQGDGQITLQSGETALLNFECDSCGDDSSVLIMAMSRPQTIDCDEERRCKKCEKKALADTKK